MHKQALPFRRMNIDYIPHNTKGIYAFWYRVTGRCIYVGQAQDIHTRLRQHWRGSHNKELTRWIQNFGDQMEFCYLPVDQGSIINRLETRLIKLLNPEENIKEKRR